VREHLETLVVLALVIGIAIVVLALTGCQVPLRNY
jgi:hypothetical protein